MNDVQHSILDFISSPILLSVRNCGAADKMRRVEVCLLASRISQVSCGASILNTCEFELKCAELVLRWIFPVRRHVKANFYFKNPFIYVCHSIIRICHLMRPSMDMVRSLLFGRYDRHRMHCCAKSFRIIGFVICPFNVIEFGWSILTFSRLHSVRRSK